MGNTNGQTNGGKVDSAALQARIAELEAALASKPAAPKPTVKIGESGTVSVYGFGRFPVSLYPDSMLRLLDMADEIRAFVAANRTTLDELGKASKARKAAEKAAEKLAKRAK